LAKKSLKSANRIMGKIRIQQRPKVLALLNFSLIRVKGFSLVSGGGL
jgi:hypothetical protein